MTPVPIPDVSVVVPCRNECQTLPELVARLVRSLDSESVTWEIVIVDDGSTDDTLPELRRHSAADSRLRYVSLSRGFGKEAALRAGLETATGSLVLMMDGDLQHPPELFGELLRTLRATGADQVVAVRSRRGEGWARKLLSRAYHRLASRSADVSLPRGHGDFRLVTRRVVDAVLALSEVNRFSRGLFTWVGFDIREVPFDDAKRDGGGSRWSLSGLVGYSIDGLLSFNDRPLRFMIHLGWVGIAVFFAYLIYVLITVAVFGIEAPGYVTLIAAIFFFGGLQLFSIGLVGEYLGRIYSETKARPLYVVRETDSTSALADGDEGDGSRRG